MSSHGMKSGRGLYSLVTDNPKFQEALKRAQERDEGRFYSTPHHRGRVDGRPIEWCEKCQGQGFLCINQDAVLHQPNGKLLYVDCTCVGLEAHNERVSKALPQSGLQDNQDITFLKSSPFPGQENQYEQARDWSLDPVGFLWLHGVPYAGKSFIAKCIGNEWLSAGKGVVFRSVPNLLDELKASFAAGSDEIGYHRLLKTVIECPLLILDDLGQEKLTEWAREKAFQITDHRFEKRLPTVVTTNWSMEELSETVPRLAVRVKDSSRCLRLNFGVARPTGVS